ncbi:hypothetical protein [Acidimangrovimonas pyrenivorans]|uniref:Glycosyltransferase family 10 (Fucosyltransferase) C-term n=1 Tax=Acidimangrovimonas pyrenivorans TaxID=2030798 RepID=A0ABV7ABU0_9RHOB
MKPGRTLAARPVSDLVWPLGCPQRLIGARVGDMAPGDHLIVRPSGRLWLPGALAGIAARKSLLITEPEARHGRHMRRARRAHRRFHRVLSSNAALLDAIPNGLFFPAGSTRLADGAALDLTKTRMLSLIAPPQRELEGHALRHRCAEWLGNIGSDADVMGHGYRPLARKADGLACYRFSLVIEPVREPGYFSEQLVDALLCKTVPIYWGAPDIADHFDPAGLLVCDSFDDIKVAVARLIPGDYVERAEAIERNRALAADYADVEGRVARAIAETL